MKDTTNEIFKKIDKSKLIRHLHQRGDHLYFTLYGINCVLIIRNNYYHLGAQLTNLKAEAFNLKQLSDVMLVLTSGVDDVGLRLFVSESDFLFIFIRKQEGNFNINNWQDEFERLLVVNSILEKLLVDERPDPSKSKAEKNWIPM